uniref:SYO1-like TPR repeats domain-containing protein n=1 Tax=Chromera velia CCMP2878 TaxID=1169474 RepID=A0A0G4I614_9ALVE|mmetsp:Transcript_29251/g.57420  ORF Transcript_29251/g.57420 Transcript_29251/m.57420 type:complete len:813 (-) Transcript_29251:92-2530(-)|eukprot:Cvel_11264.t1-p1 / transcript=Cvel_11264.t1 / gene=Cvel_11264 / organism=Chromera_velia_CCMP2878 / gene_product=hypothetical protein / transcript_product=hypothetical protein / location=Cvel_scaffold702:44282-53003(-) / protein_length=812 / sequence_SO=supercontig / SO=protein_coding / is_pseudo=false
MGKFQHKKKKGGPGRATPYRASPPTREEDSGGDLIIDSGREDLPAKLNSADPRVREHACYAAANILAECGGSSEVFAKFANLLPTIVARMTEASPRVKAAALAAFRSLTSWADPELLASLDSQHRFFSVALAALNEAAHRLRKDDSVLLANSAVQENAGTVVEALALLRTSCEASTVFVGRLKSADPSQWEPLEFPPCELSLALAVGEKFVVSPEVQHGAAALLCVLSEEEMPMPFNDRALHSLKDFLVLKNNGWKAHVHKLTGGQGGVPSPLVFPPSHVFAAGEESWLATMDLATVLCSVDSDRAATKWLVELALRPGDGFDLTGALYALSDGILKGTEKVAKNAVQADTNETPGGASAVENGSGKKEKKFIDAKTAREMGGMDHMKYESFTDALDAAARKHREQAMRHWALHTEALKVGLQLLNNLAVDSGAPPDEEMADAEAPDEEEELFIAPPVAKVLATEQVFNLVFENVIKWTAPIERQLLASLAFSTRHDELELLFDAIAAAAHLAGTLVQAENGPEKVLSGINEASFLRTCAPLLRVVAEEVLGGLESIAASASAPSSASASDAQKAEEEKEGATVLLPPSFQRSALGLVEAVSRLTAAVARRAAQNHAARAAGSGKSKKKSKAKGSAFPQPDLSPEDFQRIWSLFGGLLSVNLPALPLLKEGTAEGDAAEAREVWAGAQTQVAACSTAVAQLPVCGQVGGRRSLLEAWTRILASGVGTAGASLTAEALNSLFDVFADENYDNELAAVGTLGVLQGAMPSLQASVKRLAEGRVPPEEVSAVEFRLLEAVENAERFLDYKKSHMQ